jgi:hypothetical protein
MAHGLSGGITANGASATSAELNDLARVEKAVQVSAAHDVEFLPPEANE